MTNSIEKISLRQANSCAPSNSYPHFMEFVLLCSYDHASINYLRQMNTVHTLYI
jgi:hypothetical protein